MPESNKTEPATPRRRSKAREEGQVLRGRDLPGAAAVLAALGGMTFLMHAGSARWGELFSGLLQEASGPQPPGVNVLQQTFRAALIWTAPVVGAAWLAGAAVSMPNGISFSVPNLMRWNRLSPVRNFQSMFSAAGASRVARSVVPASVVGYLAYALVQQNWGRLTAASSLSTTEAMSLLARLVLSLCWKAALVLAAWSGVDFWLQRQTYESSLRMSRQDIKDENKESQGSPETRGRIRRLQRQMHRRRMMSEIPKATVVIANPTHFSVALRFDPGTMAAPVVVAKGQDRLALAVRRLAVWHGIPVVENVTLAQALYRHVEVGQPIPGRFYAAVAEVLAYIYRMQQRKPMSYAGMRIVP